MSKLLLNPDSAASFLGNIPLASILQRLPGLLVICFLPFCFLGPYYTPALFALYYVFLHLAFFFNVTRTAYASRQAYLKSKLHSTIDWQDKYCMDAKVQSTSDMRHDLPYDCVRHIIIIPQYKEELGTMYDTLDVLASHPMAITHYKVCLAMEEGESEASEKAVGLIDRYRDLFYDITFTLHPSNRPGEIRGKSSNVAWAAKEMVRQAGGPRLEDIITVMDADTCFASDYFASLSYHYAVASPRDRALMYFAPTTVFDRLADMQWSLGVISNMYKGSAFSPPCSAYSIPMRLAAAVGLWDVDPNSIGEDFHMYIKTFFSTHGQLNIKFIYSPASCCNVQGEGFIGGLQARSVQAKRHLWGALDLGYTIRRAIYGLLAPTFDAPNNVLQRIPFMNEYSTFDFHRLLAQLLPFFYRVVECHVFVGQILIMLIITENTLPKGDNVGYFWSIVAGDVALHPQVVLAVTIGTWIQAVAGYFYVVGVYYYEKYQHWVGVKRWDLSYREQFNPGTGEKVKPLGIRSKLQSKRGFINLLEWVCIPIVGLLFMAIPQVQVHLTQLFTNNLSYVVAAKPVHNVTVEEERQSLTQTPNRLEPRINQDRGDSGFYEFSGDGVAVEEFNPDMWTTKMPPSPSSTSVGTLATLAYYVFPIFPLTWDERLHSWANKMSYVPVNREQEEMDREIDELLQDEEITELSSQNESEEIIEMEAAPVGQSSTQYTRNDGVFANMSAKPTVGGGKTFEEIEPPTYHEAVVDPSPDYFVNCVDENTGEVLIEGFPVGRVRVNPSMTFDVLGFFLTTLMATSHAARYGSQSGLGLTLIRYGVLLKHRADTDADHYSGGQYDDPEEEKSRRQWSSMFIMAMGCFILLRAVVEFVRLRRMRSILDSIPLPYGI